MRQDQVTSQKQISKLQLELGIKKKNKPSLSKSMSESTMEDEESFVRQEMKVNSPLISWLKQELQFS